MHPKKIFVYNTFIWDFGKNPMGGGLTSVVQNYFDKRGVDW